jgi:hypothetical protein
MRKFIIILIIVILPVNFCFPVKVDLKTKIAETFELRAVKKGTEVFLERRGISVVETGENFSVWLKNFQRVDRGNGRYYYLLTVKLSYPTLVDEREAINERMIHFEVLVDQPITDRIEALEDYFGDVLTRAEKRRKREAYIGGRAAADCIVEFLESIGVIKQ